jgi:hypothetical protein
MAVKEEYYSYEKYIWTLLTEAHQHNLPMEVIGAEMSERTGINYPIYRLIINPVVKESICIVAGIHGNEIAGPLAVLRIVNAIIHDLPEQFRYVVYPMINPSGFDLRQRFDDDGRDLNAIYEETLSSKNYMEVQAFYKDALNYAPYEAFITLHEDSDRDMFYMYGLGKENLNFYHAICGFANMHIKPWSNGDIEGCTTDDQGLILSNARDHAFDGKFYKDGLAKVAYTFETPGKLDCCFRVNLMTQLVLQSINFLYAYRWLNLANHEVSSHFN